MREPYWRSDQAQISEPIVDFLEYGGKMILGERNLVVAMGDSPKILR